MLRKFAKRTSCLVISFIFMFMLSVPCLAAADGVARMTNIESAGCIVHMVVYLGTVLNRIGGDGAAVILTFLLNDTVFQRLKANCTALPAGEYIGHTATSNFGYGFTSTVGNTSVWK